MSNLRFIMRDGVKVLQQEVPKVIGYKTDYGTMSATSKTDLVLEWQDVPLVEKPRKVEEFWVVKNHYGVLTAFNQRPPDSWDNGGKIYFVREVLEGE